MTPSAASDPPLAAHPAGPDDATVAPDAPARRAWLLDLGAAVGIAEPPAGSAAAELARTGFDITELLVAVATGLRDLHDTPLDEGAPGAPGLDAGIDELVDRSRRRVAAAVVDPARFDPPYRRYAPDTLLGLVEQGRPADPGPAELAVVHGDARLAHVWFDAGRLSGWTSLAGAGSGDRYRDLATMAIDLAARLTPEALGPFFDAYGLEHPDVVRLDWHVMIDQLLR